MSDDALPPPPVVDISALRRIAEGAWVIGDGPVPLVPNVGIVLGEHSALVIDTGMGHANGDAVLKLARSLAGTRKLYLTITHFHPEHGYGADAFTGAATIVYNTAQADDLSSKGEGYLAMFKGMGPAVEAALAGTALVEADVLYDGAEYGIDLGGRTVLLKTWGRAHTNGDQVVYLPEDGILFTGDLAEEKTFPIFPWFPPDDMDIDGDRWIKVLDDCLSWGPAVVVPGHGDIGGPEILSDVRDYIVTIREKVGAAVAAGQTADETIAAIRPDMLVRHPDWHFPEWIDFAIRYFHATKSTAP